jgi:hypothetical protein
MNISIPLFIEDEMMPESNSNSHKDKDGRYG